MDSYTEIPQSEKGDSEARLPPLPPRSSQAHVHFVVWNRLDDWLVTNGVEEGAGLLVGSVAGAQLPDLLLPPLHLLLLDPARNSRAGGGAARVRRSRAGKRRGWRGAGAGGGAACVRRSRAGRRRGWRGAGAGGGAACVRRSKAGRRRGWRGTGAGGAAACVRRFRGGRRHGGRGAGAGRVEFECWAGVGMYFRSLFFTGQHVNGKSRGPIYMLGWSCS